jgi:hypothetical protein
MRIEFCKPPHPQDPNNAHILSVDKYFGCKQVDDLVTALGRAGSRPASGQEAVSLLRHCIQNSDDKAGVSVRDCENITGGGYSGLRESVIYVDVKSVGERTKAPRPWL